MNRFYVYEWYIIDTDEVFYVGKGTGNRCNITYNRNEYFKNVYNKYECDVRIYKNNLNEKTAYQIEIERIAELKKSDQAYCNLTEGGTGFASGDLNPTSISPHYGDSNGMRTQDIDFSGKNNPFYGKKHTRETKRKISEAKKGCEGLSGKDNPMYGKGYKIAGKKNGMFGRKRFKNPNATQYKAFFKDSDKYELLTYKECEKKFGIAFTRVSKNGGHLHYKKKSKNSHHERRLIEKISKED